MGNGSCCFNGYYHSAGSSCYIYTNICTYIIGLNFTGFTGFNSFPYFANSFTVGAGFFGYFLMTVDITLFLVSFSWCFEFTSKLKQQGKQEKYKILKKQLCWCFYWVCSNFRQSGGVKSRNSRSAGNRKSWRDFEWRGAILWPEWRFCSATEIVVRFLVVWRDFRRVQNCLFKLKSVPNTGVTIFGDLKCDFETWRLFEGWFLHPLLSSCMF